MSDAAGSIQIPERLRDQATAALVPLFVDGPSSDVAAARAAAASVLAGFNAATPKELQLATQIIAFGWASIACLRTAMAAKNLSIDEVLLLQTHAIGLDRSARKATKVLDAQRKQKAIAPEDRQWDDNAFRLAINQAMEKLNDANAKLAAYMATLAPIETKPKLSLLFPEPMTHAVLARRRRG
jgi:hypothetical protein